MSRQCIHCGGTVQWDPVRGWIHVRGWHDHIADAEPTMREINWPTDEEEFVRVLRQAGWEEL